MKEYIGAIIGAIAVIIAAVIGLWAKNRNHNKQVIKKSSNSIIHQANGPITINKEKNIKNTPHHNRQEKTM